MLEAALAWLLLCTNPAFQIFATRISGVGVSHTEDDERGEDLEDDDEDDDDDDDDDNEEEEDRM